MVSKAAWIGTADDGWLEADLYPAGTHWVCLFHDEHHDKTTWNGLAPWLHGQGYSVLAPCFRGYGVSSVGGAGGQCYDLDVAATLEYARYRATQVSALGIGMAGSALLEGLCRVREPIAHVILLSPSREPATGYDCLAGKAADALLWYGDAEPYAQAAAATAARLPFLRSIDIQHTSLQAQEYLDDPDYGPRLRQRIRDWLVFPREAAS